ncbi:MAG TPA: sigma-70 family RNA polymerase sigma factor [Kofleriaceae bacterium]|nr:sigma-70 family RNA polymerase sigma factor [Kofleriaceae bacterium]
MSELDLTMAPKLDVDAMYRQYGHSVLRRARQILASEDEAAEVLQELFTGLVARPHQFDGRSAPSTFLYAATTHACLSRLRNRRNRRRLINEQVQPWTTDVDPRSPEAASAVRGVLALLTDDEARAAVYHHLDGMSHAEVAEVLGCSRRHVGDLLERVSHRLVEHKEAS